MLRFKGRGRGKWVPTEVRENLMKEESRFLSFIAFPRGRPLSDARRGDNSLEST